MLQLSAISLVLDDDLHLDGVHDDPVLVAEAVVLGHDLGGDGTLGPADQLVGEGELNMVNAMLDSAYFVVDRWALHVSTGLG